MMKLSKNEFCYSSTRWTDGVAYNADRLLDATVPNHVEYDAKAAAFSTLVTDTIKLQVYGGTNNGGTITLPFSSAATVQNLMTTNDVPFQSGFYPDWHTWYALYSTGRQYSPVFVRAGVTMLSGSPCRTSGGISGCGEPCMFCMNAGDGSYTCGVAARSNDVNAGIGNNADYCGGGNSADCSSSGNWAGDRRTLVWAKVP